MFRFLSIIELPARGEYRMCISRLRLATRVLLGILVLSWTFLPAHAQPRPGAERRQQGPPPWAFPVQLPGEPASDDDIPRHLPGSNATFSLTRIRDLFVVPDWYPDDHPVMPEVVAH